MVLMLPYLIYLLQLSLRSAEGFDVVASVLDSTLTKSIAVLISWVLAHHLLAGIRFILLDFDLGVSRSVARNTAWLTHAGAIILTLLAAGILF